MATITKTEVKLEPSKSPFTSLRLKHKTSKKPKKNKNLYRRTNNPHNDTLETDGSSLSAPIPAMDKDIRRQSSSSTDNKAEANTALSQVDPEKPTSTTTEDNIEANAAVSPVDSEGSTEDNIKANTQGDSEGTSSTTDDKVAANTAEAKGDSQGSTCTTTEDSAKANTVVAQTDSEASPSTTIEDNEEANIAVAQSDSEGSPSATAKDNDEANTVIAEGDLELTSTLCTFSQDSCVKLPVHQLPTTNLMSLDTGLGSKEDEINSTASENHKAMKTAKKAKCFRKCSLSDKFKTEDLFCAKIQLTAHQSGSHSGQNSSPTLGLGAVPKAAATVEDLQKLPTNETPMSHPCDACSLTSAKTNIVKPQHANALQITSVDKCTKRCGDLSNQQITSIPKVLETTPLDQHIKVCGDSSQVNKKDPVVPTANFLRLSSTNTSELDGATASPNLTADKDRWPQNKMKLQLTEQPTCNQHVKRPASITGVNMSSPIQHNHQATPNSNHQQSVRPETEGNGLGSLGQSVSIVGTNTSGQQASSAQSENRNVMSDFLIVNTDADIEAATHYAEHLMHDIPVDNLTVDLLNHIGGGHTKLGILKTLHNSYRHILIFVTRNFESDHYEQFKSEVLLTLDLKKADNNKKYRVIPVFTTQRECDIPELAVLCGLPYFNFLNHPGFLKQSYVKKVQQLVQKGRQQFP